MNLLKAAVNLIFITNFFLLGCNKHIEEEKKETKEYLDYVNQITELFIKEAEKDRRFVCIGSGGKMPDDVKEITIEFATWQKALIDEARSLEIKLTERLLELINADEKIRPFLHEYPFKPHNARVGISFIKKNGNHYTDGSVAYVFQLEDKIFYATDKGKASPLKVLTEETYEEALKIVKDSSLQN